MPTRAELATIPCDVYVSDALDSRRSVKSYSSANSGVRSWHPTPFNGDNYPVMYHAIVSHGNMSSLT